MKNINLVKLQLSIIESQSPNISQLFSLFRFNIIVNKEIFNIEDESLNLDIAATLEFDRLQKKCNKQNYIDNIKLNNKINNKLNKKLNQF